ncbi:hypothetical protein P152DRAFT_475289 [Eremomyces bilateralis CBS 781.70]|uniref:Inheritance of peroxisomes protein 1 n=1 Tax=Eremomyces bilateralis CBS 781.70 TaxID=1392243 RepID=A0A6G1FYG5_9PEZI|nr:uncharacterized protein P152DRAFT_475289 [Eremomyces bilateralis CBS 781.70]KAF1810833.1 hypothetical protein P152DRAFT_475289 [Eremomyces bilateralis CBS 781.70]
MEPSTPSSTPPRFSYPGIPGPGVRRSFTAPTNGSLRPCTTGSPHAESNTSQGDVEVITTYGDAKIVKFGNIARLGSSRGNPDPAGTLPWTSATERTQAAGPLSIYRVKSSGVCFLNSGKFLLSIFPRSQFWCVDGESIFVMPMRDEYYRIELSVKSEEDKAGVEEFKTKIGTVLLYEKTPCPFKRRFHVELPDQPQTPARKKRIGNPDKKAKRWTLDRVWKPEDGSALDRTDDSSGHSSETTPSVEDEEEDESKSEGAANRVDSVLGDSPSSRQITEMRSPETTESSRPFRHPIRSLSDRSITVPPMLQLQQTRFTRSDVQASEPTPVPSQPIPTPAEPSCDPETASLSSVDSFYSTSENDATLSFLEPPALEDLADPDTPRQASHRRDDFETTVISSENSDIFSPTRFSEDNAIPSPPFSPGPDLPPAFRTTSTAPTSTSTAIYPSLRRAHSPLPHPSNLAVPTHTPSTLGTLIGAGIAGKLTRGLLRLIIGPPAGLVTLMVRVARRIMEGTAEWGVVDTRDIFSEVDGQVGGWQSGEEDEDEEKWAEVVEDGVLVGRTEDGKIYEGVVRRNVRTQSSWEDREGEATVSGADVD